MLSFKVSILHAKFCIIPCNRTQDTAVARNVRKKKQQCSLLGFLHPNCIIVISNNIYFVYKLLCNFIYQKLRSAYPKMSERMKLQRHLNSDFHQKLIDINFSLDKCRYKISLNSMHQFSSYTCHKIFITHTQTDTQTDRQTDIFQKQPNRVRDIPKRVNPSKTGN